MYSVFEKLLDSRGITVYKFCKETGISESTVYTWKKRGTKCSGKLAEVISNYFDVSIDYLMTGKELQENFNITTIVNDNDITNELSSLRSKLEKEILLYNGKPLDKKRRAALISVLELAIEDAEKE